MVQGVRTWRRRLAALLLILLSVSLAHAAGAESTPTADDNARPLTFGILPFVSPIALLKRFAPLREYLSREFGRPILLETAVNYSEFVRRTAARRYDLVMTAPHFVLLALQQDRYEVRATYSDHLASVIMVRAQSNFHALSQLAGLPVATPPAQAIVTLVGTELIDDAIAGGATPKFQPYASHNAAYSALAAGEVSAAVISLSELDRATSPSNGLRELARSQTFPALGILIASDLPKSTRDRLTSTLVSMNDNPAGRAVLEGVSFGACRRAEDTEFEVLRPYLRRTVEQLERHS